jgi:uncharacterized membrane protein (UPF0127 family)
MAMAGTKIVNMRDRILVIILILFFSGALLYRYNQYTTRSVTNTTGRVSQSNEVVTVNVAGRSLKLLTARNPNEWEVGLMNRRTLPQAEGMIFYFPSSDMRTFWNKNTLMDLKIIWMNKGRVVGTSDLPSIEKSGSIVTVSSPEATDTVIEVVQ